jgi:hypothetical protein
VETVTQTTAAVTSEIHFSVTLESVEEGARWLSLANQARKINFTRSGGFAGISLSTNIDAAEEPEKVRQIATELASLHPSAPSAEVYDRFVYTFAVVDENNNSREYVVPEGSLPASLHPVVNDLVQQAMRGGRNEESLTPLSIQGFVELWDVFSLVKSASSSSARPGFWALRRS